MQEFQLGPVCPQRSGTRHRSQIGLLALALLPMFACASHSDEPAGPALEPQTGMEDWPTYQHDARRSGSTEMDLPWDRLHQVWTLPSTPGPPRPAWPGHAQWDAYAGLRGLKSMRNYDPVFHGIVADGRYYFASSVDDSVHAIDLGRRELLWSFATEGPIRIAPTWDEGVLYFGSDDGRAYAIDAADGQLRWTYEGVPRAARIANNGRLISPWPCRTGVLVDRGTAILAFGLLPWKPSYLVALDADSGTIQSEGHYRIEHASRTFEGALLASATRLYLPQGRIPPALFDRKTGAAFPTPLGGGGGSFALLTPDDRLLHGPGNKTGWISDSDPGTGERLATYAKGIAVVVQGPTAYLLTDHELLAIDRESKVTRWKVDLNEPLALIRVGSHLVVGGRDWVAAFAASTGQVDWRARIDGRAYGLVAGAGRLIVSTDEGRTECFEPSDLARDGKDGIARDSDRFMAPIEGDGTRPIPPNPPRFSAENPLAWGPVLSFESRNRLRAQWRTYEPIPSRLAVDIDGRAFEFTPPETQPVRNHDVTATLPDGRRFRQDRVHQIRLGAAEEEWAGPYDLDTTFLFDLPTAPAPNEPGTLPVAKAILQEAAVDRGICLLLGQRDGALAEALVHFSRLHVVQLTTDPELADHLRERFRAQRLLGSRISVLAIDGWNDIPIQSCLANLIVLGDETDVPTMETERLVRPAGCVFESTGGLRYRRLDLPGSADWTSLYGAPDNAAYTGETLAGVRDSSELDVLWLGEPGPRYQPDRNGRKPSPLAADGRLFLQGLRRVIALDAFNGTVLWSRELPRFERFNVPRDCGNWTVDGDHLYLAMDNTCTVLDARTGEVTQVLEVFPPAPRSEASSQDDSAPGANESGAWSWGYIARAGDALVGSATRRGAAFNNFWGKAGAGWYDAAKGNVTYKVVSDSLFSRQPGGAEATADWIYSPQGVILNSTIALAEGRAWFIECRDREVVEAEARRVGGDALWRERYLVCLDLADGTIRYQHPIATEHGTVTLYLAHGEGKLALVASNTQYHVDVFDATTGEHLWYRASPWQNGDHGGHMSRPAIVSGKLVVRPAVFDLRGGQPLEQKLPKGGCGTYACTRDLLIFRAGTVTLWDAETGATSTWERLRPDCWLSTIPASGLLLSPEGGGGCSCGVWLEASIGFAPRVHLRPASSAAR